MVATERYYWERGVLRLSPRYEDSFDAEVNPEPCFCIYDRLEPSDMHNHPAPLATLHDQAVTEQVVRLLNDDEEYKRLGMLLDADVSEGIG